MTAVRRAWGWVLAWGPEASLAMLVHQGSYQTLSIARIRLSYFVFIACLLLLGVAYRKEKSAAARGSRVSTGSYVLLLPMGLFGALYLASSFWSPVPLFGLQRGLKAAVVAGLAVLAGAFFAARPERLGRLIYSVLAIGLLFLVPGLISCVLAGWENSLPSAFGVRAGVQAKSVGLVWICALGLLFAVRGTGYRDLRKALSVSVLLALATYGALAYGSRGLILALIAVGAGLVAYGVAHVRLRPHCAVAVAAVLLGTIVFFGTTPPNSKAIRLYRVLLRALSEGDLSQVFVVAVSYSPLTSDEFASPYADWLEGSDRAPSWWEMFGLTRQWHLRRVYGKQGRGLYADLSLRDRLGLAHAALVLFKSSWLVGVGAGGYAFATGWRLAHNAILEVMAETGIVGLALLGVWVAQLMFLPRMFSRRSPPEGAWGTWHILWLMLAFGLVHAQFGTLFDENRLLFLLTPILVLRRLPERHP